MSFDISKTPTLEAVATADESTLAACLKTRTDAAVLEAGEQDAVRRAAEAHRVSLDRVAKLRKAERWLSQYAKEIDGRLGSQREAALDALIEAAACYTQAPDTKSSEAKPEFKTLNEVGAWEARARIVSRAIERLVESLIPMAELNGLREEAHWMAAKSRALERIAQERAERILGQMRDAVSEEMVLPVDLSKGVSGALLAHAAEFRNRAIQLSENADRLEKMRGLSR